MYLFQSQPKLVSLTLSELANPSVASNWLFVFELEQNNGYTYKKQFVDISSYPESYNRFLITAGTDIVFEIEGDYKYSVYQMPDEISIDETEGLLVESGKMRLQATETELPTYTVNTDAKINTIDTN